MSLAQQLIELDANKHKENMQLLESIFDKLIIIENNSKANINNVVGYYDIQELAKIINLSPASIYKRIEKNEFPKQVNLGLRSVGWCKKEVHTWIDINTKKGFDYISQKGWTNIYTERYKN